MEYTGKLGTRGKNQNVRKAKRIFPKIQTQAELGKQHEQ